MSRVCRRMQTRTIKRTFYCIFLPSMLQTLCAKLETSKVLQFSPSVIPLQTNRIQIRQKMSFTVALPVILKKAFVTTIIPYEGNVCTLPLLCLSFFVSTFTIIVRPSPTKFLLPKCQLCFCLSISILLHSVFLFLAHSFCLSSHPPLSAVWTASAALTFLSFSL